MYMAVNKNFTVHMLYCTVQITRKSCVRKTSVKSNCKVYVYIVKHYYALGGMVFTTCKAQLHVSATNVGHLQVVHSCQQKSIVLKFSKSQTRSDMRYSCHHNSSHFTFPIFAHSCRFSVLHSLQSITSRIY